eukprot:922084-Pleurochrysis_carterae.AAC.4
MDKRECNALSSARHRRFGRCKQLEKGKCASAAGTPVRLRVRFVSRKMRRNRIQRICLAEKGLSSEDKKRVEQGVSVAGLARPEEAAAALLEHQPARRTPRAHAQNSPSQAMRVETAGTARAIAQNGTDAGSG